MKNKDYISHIGWYNETTKQFERLYKEEYVEELKDKLDIFMISNKTFLETINDLRKRIDKAENYLETCMINPEDLSLYENITKEECLKLLDILRGEE